MNGRDVITFDREYASHAVLVDLREPVCHEVRIVDDAPGRLVIAGVDDAGGPVDPAPSSSAVGADALVLLPSGAWMLGSIRRTGECRLSVVPVPSAK